MKQVSVTELKNRLSHFLRLVISGEVIEIVQHSIPVARLAAVNQGAGNPQALLQRLVRDGIVVAAREKPNRQQMKKSPVPCRGDVVRTLLEKRDSR
jgi:prevent-host-death family protein